MNESCLLATSNCSASSVGPQRRLLARTPALTIPGTSLWKNHPGLHTARALFPSHLLSRPQLQKGQHSCQDCGGSGGEETREGSYGKEESKAAVEVSRAGPEDLVWRAVTLTLLSGHTARLRALDCWQPCSGRAGSAVSMKENDDLNRGLLLPSLEPLLNQVPYRKASS